MGTTNPLQSLHTSPHGFSQTEKRNMAIYIAGIMLYKLGLEAFNGSIISLATRRYDQDARLAGVASRAFERVGLLTGLNYAFQCVGAIMIAPLVKRFPTRTVLATAILVFALMTAILIIVDASTGGRMKPAEWDLHHADNDFAYFGSYNTDGIIPIYCVTGVVYGMVELIRRVIPRDIVGGDVQKLRRMDALVHIFYEVSGTVSAFVTALVLIPQLGNNYAFVITPVLFALASLTWYFLSNLVFQPMAADAGQVREPSYVKAVASGFVLFGDSVWTGGRIIFTSRKFFWLLPGYAMALYGHRFLENGIANYVATRYLGNSGWTNLIVGGSNLGELLGALFVFLFTNLVRTPIPWLRIDAVMLLVVWYLPFFYPVRDDVRYAWMVAATFIPISFGWAAGDVSLAAYIQASLARMDGGTSNVSTLGAVMAFLYSAYIVVYAVASTLLGRYVDGENASRGDIHHALGNVAGVHFTVLAVLVMAATFIPQGARAWNPRMLHDEALTGDVRGEEGGHGPGLGHGHGSGEGNEMAGMRAGGIGKEIDVEVEIEKSEDGSVTEKGSPVMVGSGPGMGMGHEMEREERRLGSRRSRRSS